MNKIDITHDTPLSFLTVGQFLEMVKKAIPSPISETTIPEIYGIETLQKITGYSKAAIYAKTSRNNLPHFKRDGKLLFRHSDVFNWLTANRIETKEEFSERMDEKLIKRNGR